MSGCKNKHIVCINLQDIYLVTSRVKNSVDPDQLASEKPADLDIHCFQNGYIQVKHNMG